LICQVDEICRKCGAGEIRVAHGGGAGRGMEGA
jgi:hypothetical protein